MKKQRTRNIFPCYILFLKTINIPLGLPCDHKFCAECWTNYLVQKVDCFINFKEFC